MPQFCNLTSGIFEGEGKYNIPIIKPVYECDVNQWIGFNYIKSYETQKDKDMGVHFFLYDYMFERVWNTPDKYLRYLSRYNCVLSPDFSMFSDFPLAVRIFQHYRKHWLAAYWQSLGLTVIPTICWDDEESFEWCFDGEPKNSIVAVSDVGSKKSKELQFGFRRGYDEMIKRLNPTKIILYTGCVKNDYPGNIVCIKQSVGISNEDGDDINGRQKWRSSW